MEKLLEETDILEEQLDRLDEIYFEIKNKKIKKIIKKLMDNLSKSIELMDERIEILQILIYI